jgi:hypothetical protein
MTRIVPLLPGDPGAGDGQGSALLDAARDLLELVLDVRGMPDESERCDDLCGNVWCHESGCVAMKLRAARTAIAKAEGRS